MPEGFLCYTALMRKDAKEIALGTASLVALLALIIFVGFQFQTPPEPVVKTNPVLKSTPVDFSTDPSAPGYATARTFFSQSIAEIEKMVANGATKTSPTIAVAEVDLNQDGKPEIIAQLVSSLTCGSGGCSTAILVEEGGKWVNVLPNVVTPSVALTDVYTKGMLDLVLSGSGTGHLDGTVWKWNGTGYTVQEN